MGIKSRSGSGMTIPDHIFKSLKQFFRLKILKFVDVDPNVRFKKVVYSRKKERKIVYFPNSSTSRISTYLINDTTVYKLKVEQSTD